MITEADIAGEIGEVITGEARAAPPTTRSPSSIPPAFALQDSATVPLEYERAMAAGVGIEKKMIST